MENILCFSGQAGGTGMLMRVPCGNATLINNVRGKNLWVHKGRTSLGDAFTFMLKDFGGYAEAGQ